MRRKKRLAALREQAAKRAAVQQLTLHGITRDAVIMALIPPPKAKPKWRRRA
jgi:hypothetical protein